MKLCPDQSVLEQFCIESGGGSDCTDSEDDEESDSQDERSEESEEEETSLRSKRKAPGAKTKAGATSGRPLKKAKTAAVAKPTKYFLCLKSRDPGTGQVEPNASKGTITFSGTDFSKFTGEAELSGIGRRVTFKARKISAVPTRFTDSWESLSAASYERARVGRW